jgi:hypothetical protein
MNLAELIFWGGRRTRIGQVLVSSTTVPVLVS